jgi:hypothetical protein
MGALLDCSGRGGKEVCFFALGGCGGGGRMARSELDEMFDRVSSFDVLVLNEGITDY